MAEFKQIKIRIWQDNWFLSLNPEEKLLWFFLLTNQNAHISGLYELPKPLISPLTGIKDWNKILLKFIKDDKILYDNKWIFIINKIKHQPIGGNFKDNVQKSIKKHFEENKEILANLKKIIKPLTSPYKAPLEKEIEIETKKEIEIETKTLSPNGDDMEIIPNLLKDKQIHIQIIGLYAKAKKVIFTSKEHQNTFIRRNLKSASNLKNYDFDKIIDTMQYLIINADFKWTLETVEKYIDENLTNLNNKNINLDNI
ncbi:hypothetical protein KAS79_04210 [Candidatus Parcubacteria bacterium]|nr:hypothetical protein [Candidatus Parcubacteria bacterium]